MTPDEIAAQALADLEAKSESDLAAVRDRAAEAKARLERGLREIKAQAQPSESVEEIEPLPEVEIEPQSQVVWDFDPSLEANADELVHDDLDVATDDDGIPLADSPGEAPQ